MEISIEDIESRLTYLGEREFPEKILISTKDYPQNANGFHEPKYVITLTQEAAENFNLYGTSWKSSDYNPEKVERPIHNTLFKNGITLENLDLRSVPEGVYFMSAIPLPLVGASESPVAPVLFTKDEPPK